MSENCLWALPNEKGLSNRMFAKPSYSLVPEVAESNRHGVASAGF